MGVTFGGVLLALIVIGLFAWGMYYLIQEGDRYAGQCKELCNIRGYSYNSSNLGRNVAWCYCNTPSGRERI